MAASTGESVRDVVVFGQKLANFCHNLVEFRSRTDRQHGIHNVRCDVEATSNTLQKLQDWLDDDASASPPALTQTDHQQVVALAVKCDLIYKARMLILQKGADRSKNQKQETSTLKL